MILHNQQSSLSFNFLDHMILHNHQSSLSLTFLDHMILHNQQSGLSLTFLDHMILHNQQSSLSFTFLDHMILHNQQSSLSLTFLDHMILHNQQSGLSLTFLDHMILYKQQSGLSLTFLGYMINNQWSLIISVEWMMLKGFLVGSLLKVKTTKSLPFLFLVTVQCTIDGQFVLVVARDTTLPRLSLDSISLLGGSDAPCSAVDSNADFAIYQFPVTACGTRATELGDYVVYENKMSSSYEVGVGPLGAITRDSHFELYFQCRYADATVEALAVQLASNSPPMPVSASGPLMVELRLGSGQCVTKGCVPGKLLLSGQL
ncbi:hypothetical protein MHYP_G00054020 [Metynnis hypsauchen]